MNWVWMMGAHGKVAHAVDEDKPLDGMFGATACSSRALPLDVASTEEEPQCKTCVRVLANPCGTTAGYARHLRDKTDPCSACRKANATAALGRANANPQYRVKQRRGEEARRRARIRLAEEYPERFAELLAEERAR